MKKEKNSEKYMHLLYTWPALPTGKMESVLQLQIEWITLGAI